MLDTTQGLRFAGGSAPTGADDLGQRLEQLNAIGASLSAERDIHRLLETILTAAKTITRADGGTLYRLTDEKTLRFEIVRTSSLKYYLGGTTGNPVPFYPIQLYKDGRPNHGMVAAYSALTGKTVNIADAYSAEGFDFSGTRAFDQKTGYRSKSFLSVPMRLAKVLLQYAEEDANGLYIPAYLNQMELAFLVATTRESVNQTLKRFAREGWVGFDRRLRPREP